VLGAPKKSIDRSIKPEKMKEGGVLIVDKEEVQSRRRRRAREEREVDLSP